MKKSDYATGQYVNVFHPFDPKYFDVFIILNESSSVNDFHLNEILDIAQNIIDKAWEERKSYNELYDSLHDALEASLDEFLGYQIVIKHWSVLK